VKRRKLTTLDKLKVMVEQAICPQCGLRLGYASDCQFDHVHALALGGTDTLDNIVAVHKDCHRQKTTGRAGLSKLSVSKDGDVPKITKLKRREKQCSTPGKQKHAEAMINPVPKMDDPPHNRAQALRKVLFDWRHDNILDLEVNNLELEDLYDRLHAHWVDMKIDAERQAFEANQEKASCGR
jgi:hypothetical protein